MDHVYTNMADAYKAAPLPYLAQSDHLSLFLPPKYTPLIKRVKPTVRTVEVWPEGADAALQLQFEHTDWSVFATQATLDSHTQGWINERAYRAQAQLPMSSGGP